MKWNFQNTEHWEHLLPGEPTELRVKPKLRDDQDAQTKDEELSEEKHLDMPPSWVQQLHIGISGNKYFYNLLFFREHPVILIFYM